MDLVSIAEDLQRAGATQPWEEIQTLFLGSPSPGTYRDPKT